MGLDAVPSMGDKTLYDYWMICYRRRLPIFVLVVTAVLGAVLVGESLPPVYEARAMFYVPASATTQRGFPGDTTVPLPTSNQDDAKANIAILKGRDSIRAIHKRHPAKSLESLQRDVDFTAGRDGVIHVYVRDRDPAVAADVANGFVEYFNDFLVAQMRQRASSRRGALQDRLDELNRQLEAVSRDRRELAIASGTPTLDGEALELVRERQRLVKELEELRGSIASRSGGEARGERARPLATPAIDEVERELTRLDLDIARLRMTAMQNHPELAALLRKREAAQAALKQKLQTLGDDDKAREGTLMASLKRVELRLRSLPGLLGRRIDLDERARDLRASIKLVDGQLDEIVLASAHVPRVGIDVETAQPPAVPVFPIGWLNALVAAVASALAGILYALLLDYIDESRRHRALGAATGRSLSTGNTSTGVLQEWINPETRRSTKFDSGWIHEPSRNEQGTPIHLFTSAELRAVVVFARQPVAEFMGLADYAQAWLKTVSARMLLDEVGSPMSYGGDPAWATTGRLAGQPDSHLDVQLVKRGSDVWRAIVITGADDEQAMVAAMALRRVLLSTL
jgi:uncharacterized protein involved in exopolysaccharide biosynthesis